MKKIASKNNHNDNGFNYRKWEFVVNIVVSVALIGTLIFVIWQTLATRKSTKLLEYNIEIQNQPFMNFENCTYYYDNDSSSIKLVSELKAYGDTPAHEFRTLKDLIFYINTSSQIINDLKKTNKDLLYHYIKGVVSNILNYIYSNPFTTIDELKSYLDNIKENPAIIVVKDLGGIELSLKFHSYNVFNNIEEYYHKPTVMPPGADAKYHTGRSSENIIESIKNYDKILIYYSVFEYEGVVKNRKITTHYFGCLDARRILGRNINLKNLGKKTKGYYLSREKVWCSRLDFPS